MTAWPDRAEWRLLLVLLLCYVYFLPRYADWSQTSRVALILALVNDGRLEIDDYIGTTGDYAELGGHRYSDKAPGPALLGVPAYFIVKLLMANPVGERLIERLSQGEALRQTLKPGQAAREKVDLAIAQAVATWSVVSLPAALLGVALYRLFGLLGLAQIARLILTLAYGLGTSAFAYAGALYSHQLVAALLFGSFALLWQARAPGFIRLFVVGLFLGLALISEYPSALIIGGIGLYALYIRPKISTWLAIGLGALPPLVVMAIHNLLIFGTPLPVGYSYSTLWQAEHQSGFYSLSVPTWEALWGITFGLYRGVFVMSPFLLFGLVGLALLLRERRWRAEALVCAWSVVSFLAFNSASGMWSGGHGVGPRYLAPMLPFLVLGVGVAIWRWRHQRAILVVFGALLTWSFFVTWSLTIGGQAFPGFEPYPLWMYSWPALAQGDIARNLGTLAGLRGWLSVAPLALAVSGLLVSLVVQIPAPAVVPSTLTSDEPVQHTSPVRA